ncbi:MAG TPA: hypothetical protein DD979_13470 [Gammaproteobacteria bacterium]|nr:hypothetical protein [Gammaproteobacteria bacterium]
MSRLRKSLIIAVVSVIGTALLTGWLVRVYLSSDSFARELEAQVLANTDIKLAVDQNINVRTLVPNVSFIIPKLRVETPPSSALKVRASEVRVTLPLMQAIDAKYAEAEITVGDVTTIVGIPEDTEPDLTERAGHDAPTLDLEAPIAALKQLHHHLWRVKIGTVNVILRSPGGKSKNVQINDVDLGSDNDSIRATATYAYAPTDQQQPLTFELQQQMAQTGYTGRLKMAAREGLDRISEAFGTVGTVQLDDALVLKNFVARFGKNQAAIEGPLTLTPKRAQGKITVRRLELADLMPESPDEGKPPASAKKASRASKLFDDTPLGITALSGLDADILLEFGAVRYRNRPVISGKIRVRLADEDLDITGDDLQILGAPSQLSLFGTHLSQHPLFELQTTIQHLRLSRFHFPTEEGSKPIFTSGTSKVDLQLTMAGDSTQAIARSLSGYFSFDTTASDLSVAAASHIDKSLMSYASVNRSRQRAKKKNAKKERINCINVHMSFDNGYAIANRTIIVKTRDNLLTSKGYIDFHKEKLRYTFASDTRRFIDWSPLSLVKFLEVEGALAKPDVTVNKLNATKQGILTASSLFLGPVPSLAYSAIEASAKYAQGKPQCVRYKP